MSQQCFLEKNEFIKNFPGIILYLNSYGVIENHSKLAAALQNRTHELNGLHITSVIPTLKQEQNIINDCLLHKIPQTITEIKAKIYGKTKIINLSINPDPSPNHFNFIVQIIIIDELARKIRVQEANKYACSLNHLAIGVAHSINNPLAGITIALTNIKNRLSKADQANNQIALESGCDFQNIYDYASKQNIINMQQDILLQIQRISTIIKNTIIFGATTIEKPFDQANINTIIKNAINASKMEALITKEVNFENVKIVELYPESNLNIICNATEISLVIQHLLKNSLQAINRAQQNNPIINICTYNKNNYCHIEIHDNGTGINPMDFERIFEPFVSTDRKLAGLGLAICRAIIVNRHHGKIYPKKKIQNGTLFIIKLPISQQLQN